MREGSVGVRTAVNRASRVRDGLSATSGYDTHHCENDGQHQAETSNGNGNGKTPLGYTDGVVRRLKQYITKYYICLR